MKDPVLVVLFNETWCALPKPTEGIPIPYRLSRDPQDIRSADLLLIHIPTFDGKVPAVKPKGQLWVAWSMESEINYPILSHPEIMRVFDIRMTYRRDADVWCTYFPMDHVSLLRAAPLPKTEEAIAVYFDSNPRTQSKRDIYVRELMRHLKMDSFGKCLNNRSLPGTDKGRETKLATIARYKFNVVIENSLCDDYVTEKFYDPFIAGTVPVYLGAPNASELAPGLRSFVSIRDFKSPADLVQYLIDLSQDEKAYNEYHRWREEPFTADFQRFLEIHSEEPLKRLLKIYLKKISEPDRRSERISEGP